MSASREKKQRQNAGPDQKAIKVQQEQAARRRTTIIYSVIAAVIAVMVIALLVWRSGFFQARAAAVTLGDDTLSTAELSYYYYDSRMYTVQMASYGLSTFDSSVADADQFYNEPDGQTYRDYFLEQALDSARQQKALADEAVNTGHTEAEVKETVDAYIDSVKAQAASSGYTYSAYLRAMYGPYMTSDILESLYTRYQMAVLAANDKYALLFDSFTQSELNDYYEENADNLDTIEYSALYFPIASVDATGEDGSELDEDEVAKLEKEAQADAKDKAEKALEAVESGSTFQSQIDKYELTGAVNTDHNKVVGTSSVNSAFSEQLFELDQDACDLVETDTGYYVISFHGRYLLDEPTRDVRHIAILAESSVGDDDDGHEHAAAPTDESWAAAREKMDAVEAEWNSGSKTEDAFIALVEKYSDDTTEGGLVNRIASSNTSLIPEFVSWTFEDHQPGDTGVIQHIARDSDANQYWAYHLMYFVGENEPVWMGTVRSTLASEAQNTWFEELYVNYPTALAGGAKYLGK